ncbi:SCO family protein [Nevskia soli]|uniref:SCO family protein n=1 Tax=Nevskia soli TaxID=418856 RepID=UPI0014700A0A|nr:SCO family protein [Nevskia soli]
MLWIVALSADAGEVALPPDSVYQLNAALTTQAGGTAGLDQYRGYPVMISMFYGSCPAACPMLITGIQAYESHLDPAARGRLRVLMVSFDQARDTAQQLAGLARLHRADPARWMFASAGESDARRIAALLGISYRRQAGGEFDHSLLITLLDGRGRVLAKTSKIVGDDAFQASLQLATAGESQ